MIADTNTLGYWLNWRFFLCATWVLTAMVIAAVLIWKYEGFTMSKTLRRGDEHETVGCLNKDDTWRTCSKAIHPAWLLALRMIAFVVLLALLSVNISIDGVSLFYFYTVWTFTLVTIYFGIGSSFSIYGCFYRCNEVDDDRANLVGSDSERGSYVAPTLEGSVNIVNMPISLVSQESHDREEPRECETAGIWCYVLQVIFQISAGAVMLTDSVFWFVLYPFFTAEDHELSFLEVCMHTLNAVFLCGDILLNRLVALCISGSVISICSNMVLGHWVGSSSVLRHYPPIGSDKAGLFIENIRALKLRILGSTSSRS